MLLGCKYCFNKYSTHKACSKFFRSQLAWPRRWRSMDTCRLLMCLHRLDSRSLRGRSGLRKLHHAVFLMGEVAVYCVVGGC